MLGCYSSSVGRAGIPCSEALSSAAAQSSSLIFSCMSFPPIPFPVTFQGFIDTVVSIKPSTPPPKKALKMKHLSMNKCTALTIRFATQSFTRQVTRAYTENVNKNTNFIKSSNLKWVKSEAKHLVLQLWPRCGLKVEL